MDIRITMILPNYNGSKYLRKAIDSYISQEYNNKELIIVDGKSTDESHSIIQEYCNKSPELIWLRGPDHGISHAFNMGIDKASGDIIGYQASDVILYKNIFKEINYAASRCDFDAIYFNSYNIFTRDNRCFLRQVPGHEFTKENLLRFGTLVGWESIFFKRRIYDKYRYDEQNKYGMDFEFYLRLTSNERPMVMRSQEIAIISYFDNNISTRFAEEQAAEAKAVALKYAGDYRGEFFFEPVRFTFRKLLKRIVRRIVGGN